MELVWTLSKMEEGKRYIVVSIDRNWKVLQGVPPTKRGLTPVRFIFPATELYHEEYYPSSSQTTAHSSLRASKNCM